MRVARQSSNSNIIGQGPSYLLYDSRNIRVNLKLQVLSAVNVYVSKQQDELVPDSTGLSKGGMLLPQNQIIDFLGFRGQLYGICDQDWAVEVLEL